MANEQVLGLIELGLTNSETQIYEAMIRLGETKVGKIIKQVNISPSNVYEALDRLSKKGLIKFILKNKVRHYMVANIDNLKTLIDQEKEELNKKEKELSKAISVLKSISSVDGNREDAEIYAGLLGIRSGFKELLKDAKKEFLFFYNYDPKNVEMVHKFFSKMDIEKDYKNISTKAIFSKKYKTLFMKRKNKIDARFTSQPIPSSINICEDKTLIISWSENPVGFLIRSKDITKTFRNLFKEIWSLNR